MERTRVVRKHDRNETVGECSLPLANEINGRRASHPTTPDNLVPTGLDPRARAYPGSDAQMLAIHAGLVD